MATQSVLWNPKWQPFFGLKPPARLFLPLLEDYAFDGDAFELKACLADHHSTQNLPLAKPQ